MVEAESVSRGTEAALLLLAQKRSEFVFNDLLQYASNVCLRNPPVYLQEGEVSKYVATEPEDTLVQSLGARSLAVLIELQNGTHEPKTESDAFHISELIEQPAEFTDTINYRVLENAERFGQALIHESFAILGQDAYDWAEKLKNATTETEELTVIDWLYDRIRAICDRSRSISSAEDEQAHFYPPFRISPKFIGAFPKTDVQPSCLSASIIATSFFERADKPILHAGVTTPAMDSGAKLLGESIGSFVFVQKTLDNSPNADPIGEAMAESIIPLANDVKKWLTRPLAQHGAVYAKLSSGWLQFDPYSDATLILPESRGPYLEKFYSDLEEWKSIMPNLEFTAATVPDPISQLFMSDFSEMTFVLQQLKFPDRAKHIARIDQVLKNIPDEASIYYLYNQCLLPLINPEFHPYFSMEIKEEEEEEVTSEYFDGIFEESLKPTEQKNGNYDARLYKLFDRAFEKQVRWGESLETFIERCTNDPEYRMRRAEDLLNIPAVVAIYNAQLISQTERGEDHLGLDLGNPAMRIGLATLNDFAIYDDYPLHPSFWTTHWPGGVSVMENLDNPSVSKNDTAITYNSLLSTLMHPFTNGYNNDKIKSFLSLHERIFDDDEQEEAERLDQESRS